MGSAWQNRQDAQRDAAGGEQGLDVPAEGVGVAGVPTAGLFAFPVDGFSFRFLLY
jgi:hypothetical protein